MRIETKEDFKAFIKTNIESIRKNAIKIQDLPPDDDWITDGVWDDIYKETYNIK